MNSVKLGNNHAMSNIFLLEELIEIGKIKIVLW